MKKAHFLPSFFQVGHIKVLNEGEDWNLCQNWKTAPSANIDHFAPSSTQFYCNIHFDLSHFCVYCQWVHQHQFQKFWGNNKIGAYYKNVCGIEDLNKMTKWGQILYEKMGTNSMWNNWGQFWLLSRKGYSYAWLVCFLIFTTYRIQTNMFTPSH